MSQALIDLHGERRQRMQTSRTTEQARARILVADDSSDGRRMISDILRCLGFDVTTAENGRVACDSAVVAWKKGRAFDLVLMDSQMPIIDGYEAAALLRSMGYDGQIVALVSPCGFYHRHAMSSEAGFNGYASKPITFEMLRDVVRGHLPRIKAPAASACA